MCFGTLPISAKLAYEQGASPLPLLAVRFTIAALLLAAIGRLVTASPAPPRASVVRLLLLGAVGYAGEASLYFAALEHAPASVVELVFYSYPLWTALLGFATRLEPFRVRLLIALVLGAGGILLIFSLPHGRPTGLLLALSSSVAVAFYYIAAQVLVRGVAPARAAVYTAAGAAPVLAVASLLTGQTITAGALPWAGALGLATSIAFLALYGSISRIGSARATIAQMVEPVTTVVLAAIFLGDPLSPKVLAGAALIVLTLPVLVLGRRVKPPPAR